MAAISAELHANHLPLAPQLTKPAPYHLIFTCRMLFLMPNQQWWSTEGNRMLIGWFINSSFKLQESVHCSTNCCYYQQPLCSSACISLCKLFDNKKQHRTDKTSLLYSRQNEDYHNFLAIKNQQAINSKTFFATRYITACVKNTKHCINNKI